ncbi:DUF309 domain-containing protein [Natronobacterium texcoconense]|uniref:Predicted metal-dependent hydrolase n=1 Tax=Natronobacterium texcoconense TaxID=1095778 RepID=A0A1H0YWA1_NATTX|nr:DUF309 domain-containing protein [Natronobacterium texcoconense]SDQ19126.1 Predicted metal-dependent hydrolase [Natronobacterium texcoconense]
MREQLRAGAAIYNDGYYHAAHDAWEEYWLDLESGTDDELLLHGLIQLSGAVYHARTGNWEGAVGLAESADDYLESLPPTYRDVPLEGIRSYLASLAADPELLERRPPVRIAHEGAVPTLETLDVAATAIAAVVLAEELGFDEEPVARARTYARRDLEAGEDDSQFIALLFDFVREDDHRGLVYQRLSEHVSRRQSREEDVEGLFG